MDCNGHKTRIDRRSLLAVGASSVAAAMIGGRARAEAPAPGEAARSPAHALEGLLEGNNRFVSQPQVCEIDLAKQRASVAGGQAPWATILSCADSRVPPELVFGGRGLGELFVARNAGNLADTAIVGTLEYGAAVLGSPLIVVLGHSRCGAVKAACEVVTDNATFPGSIGPMIDPIIPAALAVRGRSGDFVDNSVRESALRTARRLAASSKTLADLIAAGKLKILAAHYDLETGKVDYLA
ncbi:MAG TPA: carbonic anhydrase [Hyphomicrobium sp.]|jgi:carbonic anhydrase